MSVGSQTFTTPGGTKLRCASNRRFWTVRVNTLRATAEETKAEVVFRTDYIGKARKRASEVTWIGTQVAASGLIFDSARKEWIGPNSAHLPLRT